MRVPAPGGRDLVGTLQLALGGTRAVVLLHEHGGGRGDWQRLQQLLLRAGISSLAIDFRGRGLSGTMDDRTAWLEQKPELIAALPEDAMAAIAFLAERTALKRDRIALLGAGLGGTVAMRCAAKSESIPAVGALSPDPTDTDAAGQLGERPLLLVCAAEDDVDVAAVAALRKAAHRATVIATPLDRLRGRGTRGLNRHEPLAGQVIDWLTSSMK